MIIVRNEARLLEKIKEFIQTHVSLFYKVCLFLTVIGLLLFVVPTFLFGSNVYQKDTGIGVANQVQIDQIQFVQLKRSYNPQRQYAEILLKASESIPNNGKLEIVAGELKTRQRIETKLLQLSSNEYVIQLYQIPQTWQDIIIDIGITYATDSYKTIHSLEDIFKEFGQKNQSATERTVQSKLFMAKAKVPKNRSLISKSVTDYQLEMIRLSIKEAQQLVKENQQTISKFLSEIAQIEKQIQVLNKEKKYQTTSEVQATEQLILSKMNRIEEAKGQIQKAEIANKEVQQKIEKLLLQKEDLRKKAGDK